MPNWCDCDLTVKGPKEELLRFKVFAQTKVSKEVNDEGMIVLDHKKFVPYPKEFTDLDKKASDWCKKNKKLMAPFKNGFNNGGYQWCLVHWGTKWGICNPELQEKARSLLYGFECAWSPPLPLIKKMGEMFPKLSFKLKYFEGGMTYQGVFEMKKGECTRRESSSYRGNRGG